VSDPAAHCDDQAERPRMKLFAAARITGLIAVLVMYALPASADMIVGYQETAGGTSGSGAINALSVPGSSVYGDTFNAPTTSISGSPSPGYGFYDDFLFTIGTGAATDSITSTINLGSLLDITDLQVRLYNTAGNPTLPVLGTPAGGAISAWSTAESYAPGETGTVSVLSTTVGPGTYVLEIRGNVTGSSGGSYSGTLNLAPVPVPATLPLLLSGIAFVGGFLRRRRPT